MAGKKSVEFLTDRIKKCVAAIKILVAAGGALVIALVVFGAVAAGTGLYARNPRLTLTVTAVAGGLAVLAAAALFITVITAYKTVSALKKAAAEEPDGPEEDKVE